MEVYRVELNDQGMIALPDVLRKKFAAGLLTLLDLEGVYLLIPGPLETDRLADEIATEWRAKGESLESMLQALREHRERYATEDPR